MKGKILGFDAENFKGVILGNDEKRYNFIQSEWENDKTPFVNQTVDFVAEGNDAKAIYSDIGTQTYEKSKIVAIVLAFFTGGIGGHKFYLGCINEGIIMAAISLGGLVIFPPLWLAVGGVALVEMIIYIFTPKDKFEEIYIKNKKCWF